MVSQACKQNHAYSCSEVERQQAHNRPQKKKWGPKILPTRGCQSALGFSLYYGMLNTLKAFQLRTKVMQITLRDFRTFLLPTKLTNDHNFITCQGWEEWQDGEEMPNTMLFTFNDSLNILWQKTNMM